MCVNKSDDVTTRSNFTHVRIFDFNVYELGVYAQRKLVYYVGHARPPKMTRVTLYATWAR